MAGFTNNKPITLTTPKNAHTIRIGGVCGYLNSLVDIIANGNMTNNGDLTLNGHTGKDEYTFKNVHFAGIVGSYWKSSTITLNNNASITNTGDLTTSSSVNSIAALQQGGFSGNYQSVVISTGSGNKIVNSGTILCEAKNVTRICLGGIYGVEACGTAPTTVYSAENTGDVTYKSAGGTSSTNGIGGIAGARSGKSLVNCRCHCTVTAWNYPNVGMITGSAYDAANPIKNCHIGGVIDTGAYGEYTDDYGVEVTGWHSQLRTIAMGNYYNIIYSTPIDAATAFTDGCGYISAIDAAPVYAEVE